MGHHHHHHHQHRTHGAAGNDRGMIRSSMQAAGRHRGTHQPATRAPATKRPSHQPRELFSCSAARGLTDPSAAAAAARSAPKIRARPSKAKKKMVRARTWRRARGGVRYAYMVRRGLYGFRQPAFDYLIRCSFWESRNLKF